MALSSILLSTTSQSSAQLKTSYNGQRLALIYSYICLVTIACSQKNVEYHVNNTFVLGHIILALSLRIDCYLVLPLTSSHLPDVEETDQEHGEKYQTSWPSRSLVEMFGDNSWIPISIPVYVSPRGSIAKTKLESYVFTFHRFDWWSLDGLRELSMCPKRVCLSWKGKIERFGSSISDKPFWEFLYFNRVTYK